MNVNMDINAEDIVMRARLYLKVNVTIDHTNTKHSEKKKLTNLQKHEE